MMKTDEGGANRSISGAGVLLSTWSQRGAFCQNVWEPQADLDNHSSQMSDAGESRRRSSLIDAVASVGGCAYTHIRTHAHTFRQDDEGQCFQSCLLKSVVERSG